MATTNITKSRDYPLIGRPLSRQEITRIRSWGPLTHFLDFYATADVAHFFDDFLGDTIPGDNWAVANGGGASVASFAVNVQENGVIRGTTGTAGDATASASLISPKIWYGDRNAMCIFRWKPVTAVTEVKIEVGFTDVVPGSTAAVVNNVSTPTVNGSVADAALLHFRDLSSTITNELVTIGTSITAAKTTFTPKTTRASGTYVNTRIQIVTNQVFLWDDGALVASHNAAATDYVEGGNGLALWAYVAASNATSKSLDIDYVRGVSDRN